MLAFVSTHHAGGDGSSLGDLQHKDAGNTIMAIEKTFCQRLLIFLIAVGSEMVTWILIFIAGVLWINSAPTVDLVIRSTVSVMFVLNVDELVFESCCVREIMDDVEETKYRIRKMNPGIIHRYYKTGKTSVARLVTLSGHQLEALDVTLLHGKTSDAYLVLLQNGTEFHRTSVIAHSLEPEWGQHTLLVKKDVPIHVQCWDYDKLSRDDEIGSVLVPYAEFLRVGEHILRKADGSQSGVIRVEKVANYNDSEVAKAFVSQWAKIKNVAGIYVYLPFLMLFSFLLTWLSKFTMSSCPRDMVADHVFVSGELPVW
eukprot:CAMPEP_0173079934 /NCGR_PEP_ID=MMETSP1102-20130122/15625_1 /TAXON_ID=49646 /ORGANISM="Geminigera sp., Strain Caron Lab Isolate" /LENGTH=312 /DNA_ID=CAMNT_0013952723 /DNA_START=117 /DNA_END=1055 /DNA_ORIENTATION=-